jgi:hypothetical protein
MDKHTQLDKNNPINWEESEEDREHAKSQLIVDTLQELTIKYLGDDANEYLNSSIKEDLHEYDTNDIFDELQDNGYFQEEIIYYSKAMQYLIENDCSLSESLEIAHEYGYNLDNLNSETLATIHASRKKENDFYEYVAPELDKIINN